MKYCFIEEHEAVFPVEKMCQVLAVSSGGYYRYRRQPLSNRTLKKKEIQHRIESLYFTKKQRYGSPRITAELHALGYSVTRVTVARYMRELGLKSKLNRKFKATTDSQHRHLVADNVLNRNFIALSSSRAWVSDITYIPTTEGFLYLTAILDLYDRQVIGWSLSTRLHTEETTLPAWRMALKNRSVLSGLIFHSDRGVQYAAHSFVNTLESYSVIRSMSRKGNCWDNAVAESFFKTLKTELIYGNKLKNRKQTELDLFEYIEVFYNKQRRHSHLDYQTIEEFNNLNNFYHSVA